MGLVLGFFIVTGFGFMLWQLGCCLVCKIKGHRHDGLDEKIEDAVRNTATWAKQYRMESLVVHVYSSCSRCGQGDEAAVTVEGFLVDDRWLTVTTSDLGVLVL